ncbi:hypothetical protein PUN28_001547 [Cardiocondyla obscurior]|uniref:Secreted protein n=1 Tax=Cardiocondyla obscurior TaxID=286306 RepID=A0AAW2H5K5_9HYME
MRFNIKCFNVLIKIIILRYVLLCYISRRCEVYRRCRLSSKSPGQFHPLSYLLSIYLRELSFRESLFLPSLLPPLTFFFFFSTLETLMLEKLVRENYFKLIISYTSAHADFHRPVISRCDFFPSRVVVTKYDANLSKETRCGNIIGRCRAPCSAIRL